MIDLGALALLRPYWLIVLPALLLLLRATHRRDAALGDWRRAIDPPLLDALLRRQGGDDIRAPGAALYWSVALIALALSGPATKTAQSTQFRNLDTTLALLDVSRAETLPQTLAAAQRVLSGSGGRQTGLVLYAGDAYLASPLTDDAGALEAMLFSVDAETVPDGGARPDRALAFARRVLLQSSAFAGDILLISAGEGVDARAQAQAAALAAEGHALHTLFVAPPGADADAAATRRAALATLAAKGHGRAGEATRVDEIVADIAGRPVLRVEQGARRALEWQDWGRLLLLVAAAPLLLALRRGAS